jgi:hypothetical protein
MGMPVRICYKLGVPEASRPTAAPVMIPFVVARVTTDCSAKEEMTGFTAMGVMTSFMVGRATIGSTAGQV